MKTNYGHVYLLLELIPLGQYRQGDQEIMKKKYITAKGFDAKFEAGEDIVKYLDADSAIRPGNALKRVNVDFPIWMIKSLDNEAKKLGVTRQSIIKVWIAEKLKELA